jgi:hypothetical protein
MEAEELRIGNYVNIGLKSSDLRTDYDAITASGLMDLQVNKERSSFIYEPIPLTEEWLVKFGFSNNYDKELPLQKAYKLNDLILSQDFTMSYADEYMVNFGNPLKHVHQLQNLYFSLTNKELTIKL